MTTLRRFHLIVLSLFIVAGFALVNPAVPGQGQNISGNGNSKGPGRAVTVPVTIRVKEETELQNIDLTISEDGEIQTIL